MFSKKILPVLVTLLGLSILFTPSLSPSLSFHVENEPIEIEEELFIPVTGPPPEVTEEPVQTQSNEAYVETKHEALGEEEPIFIRGTPLAWETLQFVVGDITLPRVSEVLHCGGCSVQEINDKLGYVYEWKIVKDHEVLYFHSGVDSLGLAIINLHQSGTLGRGTIVALMDDEAKEYFTVTDIVELDRDYVAENEYFSFEENYQGQIILFTCSDINVPWHPYTPKLVIQLTPF